MTEERELLEAAARAAGLTFARNGDDLPGFVAASSGDWRDGWCLWDPLTDDADALRLAVKLKLLVDFSACVAAHTTFEAPWFGGGEDQEAGVSHDECDPYHTTRRAIVRAAAAMAPKG